MSLVYSTPPLESASMSSKKRRNHIYLGSKADAKDRAKLERWGVTHILNVTPEKEAGIKSGIQNYFEKDKKFTYRRIPVYDNATTDMLQYAPSIVSFVSNALHYGSILVHCQRGVSRSTTCVILYLMNKVGMTLDGAIILIKRRRAIAAPIPAFLKQLKEYEQQCLDLNLIKEQDLDKEQASRGKEASDKSTSSRKEGENKKEGCYDDGKKRKAETQGTPEKTAKRQIGPSLPPHLMKGE